MSRSTRRHPKELLPITDITKKESECRKRKREEDANREEDGSEEDGSKVNRRLLFSPTATKTGAHSDTPTATKTGDPSETPFATASNAPHVTPEGEDDVAKGERKDPRTTDPTSLKPAAQRKDPPKTDPTSEDDVAKGGREDPPTTDPTSLKPAAQRKDPPKTDPTSSKQVAEPPKRKKSQENNIMYYGNPTEDDRKTLKQAERHTNKTFNETRTALITEFIKKVKNLGVILGHDGWIDKELVQALFRQDSTGWQMLVDWVYIITRFSKAKLLVNNEEQTELTSTVRLPDVFFGLDLFIKPVENAQPPLSKHKLLTWKQTRSRLRRLKPAERFTSFQKALSGTDIEFPGRKKPIKADTIRDYMKCFHKCLVFFMSEVKLPPGFKGKYSDIVELSTKETDTEALKDYMKEFARFFGHILHNVSLRTLNDESKGDGTGALNKFLFGRREKLQFALSKPIKPNLSAEYPFVLPVTPVTDYDTWYRTYTRRLWRNYNLERNGKPQLRASSIEFIGFLNGMEMGDVVARKLIPRIAEGYFLAPNGKLTFPFLKELFAAILYHRQYLRELYMIMVEEKRICLIPLDNRKVPGKFLIQLKPENKARIKTIQEALTLVTLWTDYETRFGTNRKFSLAAICQKADTLVKDICAEFLNFRPFDDDQSEERDADRLLGQFSVHLCNARCQSKTTAYMMCLCDSRYCPPKAIVVGRGAQCNIAGVDMGNHNLSRCLAQLKMESIHQRTDGIFFFHNDESEILKFLEKELFAGDLMKRLITDVSIPIERQTPSVFIPAGEQIVRFIFENQDKLTDVALFVRARCDFIKTTPLQTPWPCSNVAALIDSKTQTVASDWENPKIDNHICWVELKHVPNADQNKGDDDSNSVSSAGGKGSNDSSAKGGKAKGSKAKGSNDSSAKGGKGGKAKGSKGGKAKGGKGGKAKGSSEGGTGNLSSGDGGTGNLSSDDGDTGNLSSEDESDKKCIFSESGFYPVWRGDKTKTDPKHLTVYVREDSKLIQLSEGKCVIEIASPSLLLPVNVVGKPVVKDFVWWEGSDQKRRFGRILKSHEHNHEVEEEIYVYGHLNKQGETHTIPKDSARPLLPHTTEIEQKLKNKFLKRVYVPKYVVISNEIYCGCYLPDDGSELKIQDAMKDATKNEQGGQRRTDLC